MPIREYCFLYSVPEFAKNIAQVLKEAPNPLGSVARLSTAYMFIDEVEKRMKWPHLVRPRNWAVSLLKYIVGPAVTYPGRKDDPRTQRIGKALLAYAQLVDHFSSNVTMGVSRWVSDFRSFADILDLQYNPETGEREMYHGRYYRNPDDRTKFVEGAYHYFDVVRHPAHFDLNPAQRAAITAFGWIVKQHVDSFINLLESLRSELFMDELQLSPAERENYGGFTSLITDYQLEALREFSKRLAQNIRRGGRIPLKNARGKQAHAYAIYIPMQVSGLVTYPTAFHIFWNALAGRPLTSPAVIGLEDTDPVGARDRVPHAFISPFIRKEKSQAAGHAALVYSSNLAPASLRAAGFEGALDLAVRYKYAPLDETLWNVMMRHATEYFATLPVLGYLASQGVPIPWTMNLAALRQLVQYEEKPDIAIKGRGRLFPGVRSRLNDLATVISGLTPDVEPFRGYTPYVRTKKLAEATGVSRKGKRPVVVVNTARDYLDSLSQTWKRYQEIVTDELYPELSRDKDLVPVAPKPHELLRILDFEDVPGYREELAEAYREAGVKEKFIESKVDKSIKSVRSWAFRRLAEDYGLGVLPSDFVTMRSFLQKYGDMWGMDIPMGFTPHLFFEESPEAAGEEVTLRARPRTLFWQRRLYPPSVAALIENQMNALMRDVESKNRLWRTIENITMNYNTAIRGASAADFSVLAQQGGLGAAILLSNLTWGELNLLLPREFRMSQKRAWGILAKYFGKLAKSILYKDPGAYMALVSATSKDLEYWGPAWNTSFISTDMVNTLHFTDADVKRGDFAGVPKGGNLPAIFNAIAWPAKSAKKLVIDRGQIAFEGALALLTKMQMDAFRDAFPDASYREKMEFLHTLKTTLGILDPRTYNLSPGQRSLETRFAFFSIRFARSQGLLFARLMGELLTAADPEARAQHHFRFTRLFATGMATYLLLYTMINLLAGEKEIDFGVWDPDEPEFLGFTTVLPGAPQGGIVLRPGGWYRDLAFLLSMGINTAKDPMYIIRGDSKLHSGVVSDIVLRHPTFRFFFSKRAPAWNIATPLMSVFVPIEARIAKTSYYGQATDLMGVPILSSPDDFGRWALQNAPSPFWMRTMLDIYMRETPGATSAPSPATIYEMGMGGLGEFFGANVSVYPAYKALDNYMRSIKNPDGSPRFPDGMMTYPTEENQKRFFLDNDPYAIRLQRLHEWQRDAFAGALPRERAKVQREFQSNIGELEKAFMNGKIDGLMFRKFAVNLERQYRDHLEELALNSITFEKEKPRLTKLVEGYYDLMEDPRVIIALGKTGDPVIDVDTLAILQTEYLRKHPEIEPLINGVEDYPGFEAPIFVQLNEIQRTLRNIGWWDAEKTAWQNAVRWHNTYYDPDIPEDKYLSHVAYVRDRYEKFDTPLEEQEFMVLARERDPVIKMFEYYRKDERRKILLSLPEQERERILELGLRFGYLDVGLEDIILYNVVE